MYNLQQQIYLELQLRNQFKERVWNIIIDRCVIGHGKVSRGSLQCYIYNKLGFHGRIGNKFAKMLTKIIEENGFRATWLNGAKCFRGLSWKNEDKQCWRYPTASDLPFYNGKEYEMPHGI